MNAPWSVDDWVGLDSRTRTRLANSYTDEDALCEISRAARGVLRAFSSSFFLVTRFLPARKRNAVDSIYAAVRYPDEVVDTFPVYTSDCLQLLDRWEDGYREAVAMQGIRQRLAAGVPWILAGFAELVKEYSIPPAHYYAFLAAMRRDLSPRPFHNLPELIDEYVYGSAVVVGYFLAHVYGTAPGVSLAEAYDCARDLGIALQLTNFCRDVAEDRRRGRIYLPNDVLNLLGVTESILFLAETAEARYERAVRTLEVFAADTRPAIRACIDVYRLLNRRILNAPGNLEIRHSVPVAEKFSALPSGKYWRVPLAYLGAL